jgi:DNA-binding MarR family transcriptional regulator
MTLEKDIKQTRPFKSSAEKAMVNVMFTNNWICDQQFKILKKYGLSIQQYNVLRILKGHSPEPITINGIIERMLDKMSNASRLVDKLVQKDLVVRTYRKDDRRACDVIISTKGTELIKTVNIEIETFETSFGNLTPDELNTLNILLDKFRGSI